MAGKVGYYSHSYYFHSYSSEDEGVVLFRQAVRMKPAEHLVNHYLGMLLMVNQTSKKAIKAGEMSRVHNATSAMQEAAALFRAALVHKPAAPETLFGLAAALYTEGNIDQMEEFLEK